MKKYYLFFLFISVYMHSNGQTNCSDAYSDVNYAYSHVKSAYKSNNIDHLKHYSKRSLEVFERAKVKLKACKCEKAYDFAYDALEFLSHVEDANTYEDGRYYVKNARDIAKDVINELELCTELTKELTNEDQDSTLTDLQSEQLKLEQQQAELKRQEQQLKQKLAEREEKEQQLKKELLISKNEIALDSNIKAYNELLVTFGCNTEVIKADIDKSDLTTKNIDVIKSRYLSVAKEITSTYLKKLNKCSLR